MAEIVNHLQNLTGATLSEVFLSLNLLIKQHDIEIKNNIDYIIRNFKSDNHLKQLVKISLIDKYQCYNEMLNVLKSDDSFCISQILLCSWFFKYCDYDPNTVFPMLSFSVRCKVLKKYSKFLKDTKTADSLFVFIKNRYGIKAAIVLLPACSENFIKQFLECVSIQIPVYIIIPIFNSYPSVVFSYITYLLEARKNKERAFQEFRFLIYEELFRRMASKEPKRFSNLIEKYHETMPFLRLGRRSTKNLLDSSFDAIKNNIEAYVKLLDWKNVTINLNVDQLSTLQLAAFPKTPADFIKTFGTYCDFMSIISHIKRNKVKQNILIRNFQKAYGKPITDYSNSFGFELVCKLSRDIIEKWVELKLPEVEDLRIRGKYTIYLPVEKAIPEMKKMLENQSDINIRSHLMSCLFEIVNINDDPQLLGPLCEYVVKRFRNDRALVKANVIKALYHFNINSKIPDEAWFPIEELLNIMIISDEVRSCPSEFTTLLSKQIQHRFERGLAVEEHLDKLMKVVSIYYNFDLCANTPYEKMCLEWFIKWTEKIENNSNIHFKQFDSIFPRLFEWNIKHPINKIEIPQWMNDEIEKIFKDEKNSHRKIYILESIKKDKNELLKLYDKIYLNYMDPKILIYKLRTEPLAIKHNLTSILHKLITKNLDSYVLFFNQARLYNFIGIPELFCDLSLKELKDENSTRQNIRNAIMILSLMLPTSKYVEFISKYYPKHSKIDDYSDKGKKILEIQTEISLSFKSINNPSDIMESISKFAVGDYLKLIVGPLNSVFLRISEYKILPILKTWLGSPVSVRKHFIRAFFKIAPKQSKLEIILDLFKKENNISIRLIIVENSLRFFLDEPCDDTFTVLKAVVVQLQPTDDNAYNQLFNIHKVPDKFISDYFQLLWYKSDIKSETHLNNRLKIIRLIEPTIFKLLTEEFYDTLVSHLFQQESLHEEMQLFVVHYLLNSVNIEQQNRRVDKVIYGMKRLFDEWDLYRLINVSQNLTTYIFSNRIAFISLVGKLVRESLTSTKSEYKVLPAENLLRKFQTDILTVIKEEDIIEEILLLDITSFFLSFGKSEISNIEMVQNVSKFIESIVDKTVTEYSISVIDSFHSAITKFCCWTYSDPENKMFILSESLLSNNSIYCISLGIKLLPCQITENIDRYEKNINNILKISDKSIKPFINKLIKELTTKVRIT